MTQALWSAITQTVSVLEEVNVAYNLINDSALFAQGVELVPDTLEVAVQWDLFPNVHERFAAYGAGTVEDHKGWSVFTLTLEGVPVRILCYYNTVIVTDPGRVAFEHEGHTFYAKSVMHYRRSLAQDDPRQELIRQYFVRKQHEISEQNEQAWNFSPYEAWTERYGEPSVAVERIKKDPLGRLRPLGPFLGDVSGKKIANLLGSHGSKAVALALLGAQSTVVDISSENARYATELAEVAGVPLHYVVSDLLELPANERTGDYDLVLMENGILHYFIDLLPVTKIIAELLAPGGRVVLYDFHPISTKLITSKGKKHKVTGDYFYAGLYADDVAYSKLLTGQSETKQVRVRKWTLGEIVTAMADAGLFIRLLEEEPNTKIDDMGIPKMYTLIAEKL